MQHSALLSEFPTTRLHNPLIPFLLTFPSLFPSPSLLHPFLSSTHLLPCLSRQHCLPSVSTILPKTSAWLSKPRMCLERFSRSTPATQRTARQGPQSVPRVDGTVAESLYAIQMVPPAFLVHHFDDKRAAVQTRSLTRVLDHFNRVRAERNTSNCRGTRTAYPAESACGVNRSSCSPSSPAEAPHEII